MKGALVFVQGPAHFKEMFRAAELLLSSGKYDPTLLFAGEYAGLEADVRKAAASGIRVVRPQDLVETERASPPPAPVQAARAMRRIRSRRIGRAIAFAMTPFRPVLRRLLLFAFGLVYRRWPSLLPTDVRAQRESAPSIARFMDAGRYALLVLPEDNFHYFTNQWIRAIHERGGAAVIVPFTIADERELSESFVASPVHDADNAMNWLVAAAFPRWVREYKGRRLVMPPDHVLHQEYLGIAPPRPWLINSGRADALAAESAFAARYYVRAGIEPARVRVTGALSDDLAYHALSNAEERREALYAELRIAPRRPLVVWAIPPDQLGGIGRPECEFESYEALVAFCLRPLEALTDAYNVVLSLHPRSFPEDSRRLERGHVRVSQRDVAELIPLARFYVASSSATIRLAVACGIPVVNYDVYRYGYSDFAGIPGVIGVDDGNAYAEAVARLARDAHAYEEARAAQAAFAAREMPLDGRAGTRLIALFDELTRAPAAVAA